MNLKIKKRLLVLLGICGLILLTLVGWKYTVGKTEFIISTQEVEKGSLSNTITATGTLEATNTVVVGTQVSGVIEKLYVDFNSLVKKGQLIAELDKSTLQSSLETSEADLEKAKAEYEYHKSGLERSKSMFDKEMLANSEYDLAVYNFKISSAGVKSARANLQRARLNLSYASIYSPIDGVVLNRAVEVGQTVAASMSTPELYTITNNLSTMQVEADVDEADIGVLVNGQRAEFTVDAFSDLTFSGKVSEIRLQPNESSNVITYTVIVTVENPEFKLKPGMTASITAYVEEAEDILIVPGKAVRFEPEREMLESYMGDSPENNRMPPSDRNERPSEGGQGQMTRPQVGGTKGGGRPELDDTHKRVWVKDGEIIRPVMIEVGVDDGSNLEVIEGLKEGDLVITAMLEVSSSEIEDKEEEEQKSPFIQSGSNKRGGGGPPH